MGYRDTKRAVQDHVSAKYKISYRDLLASTGGKTATVDVSISDLNSIYLTEAGFYQLIFSSRLPEAVAFREWVFESVLPSIRKTGKYSIDQSRFNPELNNPTGERKLHYKVIKHIKNQYPSVIIIPGLGENQSTSFKRIDSNLKGYISGQPDIILLSKFGTYTDVVSLELKCPEKNIILPDEQLEFHKQLEKVNVFTLVSSNYDEIIIFLHEHFKTLTEKAKKTTATTT